MKFIGRRFYLWSVVRAKYRPAVNGNDVWTRVTDVYMDSVRTSITGAIPSSGRVNFSHNKPCPAKDKRCDRYSNYPGFSLTLDTVSLHYVSYSSRLTSVHSSYYAVTRLICVSDSILYTLNTSYIQVTAQVAGEQCHLEFAAPRSMGPLALATADQLINNFQSINDPTNITS